jgi:hypothetical protein
LQADEIVKFNRKVVHVFAKEYGWSQDTTLSLTLQDKDHYLRLIKEDREHEQKEIDRIKGRKK